MTIWELAETIESVLDYQERVVFDGGKPDGRPRKLLAVSRRHEIAWKAMTPFRAGLEQAYRNCLDE